MKDKFISFYNTRALEQDFVTGSPEIKSTILYNYIYVDNVEFKEEQSISMTYNKEFKDQFKQFLS